MSSVLISQLIQLFTIMFIGYMLFKTHIFTLESNQILTRFLLDCTLPFQVLGSVMNPETERDFSGVSMMFLFGIIMFLSYAVIGVIIAKVMRYPKEQQGIYIFSTTFPNAGFMGLPIIAALMGEKALVYAAITVILFNVFSFTLGVICMNYDGKLEGGIRSVSKLIDLKQLLTPSMIGIFLGLIIYFLPIHFPEEIKGVCVSIGNITSPLAMLIIGSVLAKMPFKQVINDWRVYLYTLVRQLLVPLATWPILCMFFHDDFIRLVLFIQFAMPVGNTVVLFATKYGKDEELAARIVFVTTILSIITLPACMMILGI